APRSWRHPARVIGGGNRGSGACPPDVQLIPEVRARIDGLTLDQDFEVEVRAGRAPRVAGPPDDGATLDPVARLDVRPREMTVDALDVLTVVEDDRDAVLLVRPRHGDSPTRRRAHGGAVLGANVETAVELRPLRPR